MSDDKRELSRLLDAQLLDMALKTREARDSLTIRSEIYEYSRAELIALITRDRRKKK